MIRALGGSCGQLEQRPLPPELEECQGRQPRDGGSTPTPLGLPPPISCQCLSMAKPNHLDAWETRKPAAWEPGQSRAGQGKGLRGNSPGWHSGCGRGAFQPQSMQTGALEMPARSPPCPRPRAHLTSLDDGIGCCPAQGLRDKCPVARRPSPIHQAPSGRRQGRRPCPPGASSPRQRTATRPEPGRRAPRQGQLPPR